MISVIIPILNEKRRIEILLDHLNTVKEQNTFEVIVVDAGNEDSVIEKKWPWVYYLRSEKSRAIQLNAGAGVAAGDVLYFVHADVLPPFSFPEDIVGAVKKGYPVGCFRTKLVPEKFLTNLNSYFSRFNGRFCGGGDQTLFIQKELFCNEGGFNESYCIMEDFEFVRRLKPKYGFHIIQKDVRVSARKYEVNSYWRVNLANYKAFRMFEEGVKPELIRESYYSWVKRGDED